MWICWSATPTRTCSTRRGSAAGTSDRATAGPRTSPRGCRLRVPPCTSRGCRPCGTRTMSSTASTASESACSARTTPCRGTSSWRTTPTYTCSMTSIAAARPGSTALATCRGSGTPSGTHASTGTTTVSYPTSSFSTLRTSAAPERMPVLWTASTSTTGRRSRRCGTRARTCRWEVRGASTGMVTKRSSGWSGATRFCSRRRRNAASLRVRVPTTCQRRTSRPPRQQTSRPRQSPALSQLAPSRPPSQPPSPARTCRRCGTRARS
mmetsp:Transcript_36620/g.87384  ORF Transcript_36620/g.87384 Transcript_36620/m.87384 type:complete len:265 (+) Transcript_36620:1080-1874(+)